MPDLLTHVLVAYVLATLLSFKYDWITPTMVTVAMLGAIVPDLTKISLVIPNARMEALLGIPFDWFAVHTVAGSVVAVAIGALLVRSEHRKRVFFLLLLGALSHHFLDAILINPTGYSYALFFPVTSYHPPTPGLFLSSDRWPAVVSALLAGMVWYLRYHRFARPDTSHKSDI